MKNRQIIKINKKEARYEGSIGKYLNKHIAPGRMYAFEDDTNLIGSCLYNKDLLWSRVEAGYLTGVFDPDDIGKTTNTLESLPLWIDDTEFISVADLCEKCRQMKEKRNIQFVVIDDFQRLALPNSDEILWQLCKIAQKFDIVLVGMKRATCDDTDEHHQPRRRRKRNQAKGLDAILRAGYAE